MFTVDDKYIILVILCPGIFALGLLYILFQALHLPFVANLNYVLVAGFGVVSSLFIGLSLFYCNKKEWFVKKYRLGSIAKEIKEGTLLKGLTMNLNEINQKFQLDFGKTFFSDSITLSDLRLNFDDIYFGLDRKIGLKMPSALKLLREFLQQIIIVFKLSFIIYFIVGIIHLIACYWEEQLIYFYTISLVFFMIWSIILHKTLSVFDRRFYYALLNVYTAKHYQNIFSNQD